MPELPEVKTVVMQLKKLVIDKKISKIEVIFPKLIKEYHENEFKDYFENETIFNVENYGKFIVFFFSNEKIMLSHLRMEGGYNFYTKKTSNKIHDRLIFNFTDGTSLHYHDSRMFGTFHLRNEKNYLNIKPLSLVGKVPWKIDLEDFYNVLQKKNSAIKKILLDQHIIAGLGNIYVDETLFAANIHPETKANKLSLEEVKNILEKASKILQKSIKLGGSSIRSYTSLNKQEGSFQNFLQVHTKEKKPCNICKTSIKKIKVGGRGTYFCPSCQTVKF